MFSLIFSFLGEVFLLVSAVIISTAIPSVDKFTFAIFVHRHFFHFQIFHAHFCTRPFWHMAIKSMAKFSLPNLPGTIVL